jgi:hypothetical protein
MIFIGKNNNPLIMKLCEYAFYAYTCLHKNYGTVLTNINCSLSLGVLKCLGN